MSTPTPPTPPPNENSQQPTANDLDVSKPELKDIADIVREVPEADRGRVISTLLEAYAVGPAKMAKMTHFSGPFPHPDILRGMNDVVPGSAAQVIQMAVNQSDHRRATETLVIKNQLKQSGRGQTYGLIIAVLALVIAGFLIYKGHDAAGGVLGTVDLVALVSVFVVGQSAQKKEVQAKKDS